ncbi:MAG: FAD-dependent oxidoreductase [Candidatus Nitrosocosmicus sp.]
MSNKIVIIGAGYAGVFLSTNLSSKLKDLAEIILIDRNSYHQLMQEIHLVASGFRTEDQLKIPISSLIQGKKIKFIQSNVKKILPDKKTVMLDSEEIKYDELIICLGSSLNISIFQEQTNTLYPFDPYMMLQLSLIIFQK